MTIKIVIRLFDGNCYNIPKELNDKIVSNIRERCKNNIIYSNWWYLHGKLEDIVGYNKGIIINMDEIPHTTKNRYFKGSEKCFNVIYINDGIYDVEVIGIDKPCVGYFYTFDNKTRGLVCLKDDKEACDYAYSKYIEKSLHL